MESFFLILDFKQNISLKEIYIYKYFFYKNFFMNVFFIIFYNFAIRIKILETYLANVPNTGIDIQAIAQRLDDFFYEIYYLTLKIMLRITITYCFPFKLQL